MGKSLTAATYTVATVVLTAVGSIASGMLVLGRRPLELVALSWATNLPPALASPRWEVACRRVADDVRDFVVESIGRQTAASCPAPASGPARLSAGQGRMRPSAMPDAGATPR